MEEIANFENLHKRYKEVLDECVFSYEEMRDALVIYVKDMENQENNDYPIELHVKEEYINKASEILWKHSKDGVLLKSQVELFAMMLYALFSFGFVNSKLEDDMRLYHNESKRLQMILKSNPSRIHCKTDDRNGLSCTITSEWLMMIILKGLEDTMKYNREDAFSQKKMRITEGLGKFVCAYENTASLIIGGGKITTYAFIGDLVYLFIEKAPNPQKWGWSDNKEKYDIVKAWKKQYLKNADAK